MTATNVTKISDFCTLFLTILFYEDTHLLYGRQLAFFFQLKTCCNNNAMYSSSQ